MRAARLTTAPLAAAVCVLVAAPSASAATITAGPLAASAGYLTPNVSISKGEALTFTNLDVAAHDVISRQTYRPKRKKGKPRPPARPLFASALIGLGESAEVEGIERVKSGKSYEFYCSLHASMTGTLTVN
jgi:plastocyanin